MGPITSWHDLKNALRRQSWLIFFILLVGMPAAYLYAKSRPSEYQAMGVLGIEVPQGEGSDMASGPAVTRRLDEVEAALMSRGNLLDLADQFEIQPEDTEVARIRLVRDSITITRLVDQARAWDPQVVPFAISISVRQEDPEAAAAMVNVVLEQAVEEDSDRVRQDLTSALQRQRVVLDYLVGEEARVEERMALVEADLAELRAENVEALPENLEVQRERLADLEEQREGLDRQLQSFASSQNQLGDDLAERRSQQIAEQRAEVQADIEEIEAILDAAPGVERELSALNRQIRSLEAELSAISGQRTQAELNQQLGAFDQVARLFILEPALVPDIPISGSRARLAMAGGMGVLMLAFGLALAREILHPGIRNTAQMKAQLGVEPVVVIPYVRSPTTYRRRLAGSALLVGAAVIALVAEQWW